MYGCTNVVQLQSITHARVTHMASTYHHSELSFHSLSPAPRSFFRSSTRLPDWQSFTAGRVATRVRVEVWDCNASIAKWTHAHPNVCMRRLRTVVRRPNLDHQTQLAVQRASQHASRSPADSTVLLPRRGPFGWHTHLRLPSASRASKPSLFHLAVKATTTH
jgi:hypothetical protein